MDKSVESVKFYVFGGGDNSVGIPDTDATIVIDDNYTWDDDMVEEMKVILREFYDVPEHCVQTEAEVDAENEAEEEHYRQMQSQINPDEA